MKNKELLCAMLLATCMFPMRMNAQLKVTASGDVTVSKNLNVNKNVNIAKLLSVSKDVTMSEDLSVGGDMSLGTASVDNHIGLNLYKTTTPTTDPYYGIKSYMLMNSSMPTCPLYGVHSVADAFSCSGMCTQYPIVAVYGCAKKSYNYPNVFAAGIAGVAHLYGGIAVYGGTNYGATLPTSMPSGCYAGYFNGTVNVNGTLFATDLSIPSNSRQTENTRGINSSLADNIHLLNPVAYTIRQDSAWIDDKDANELRGVHYGLIAEDVQKVLPDIVYERNGELSVNYIELIPLLIKEIQELSDEVKELKNANRAQMPAYKSNSQKNESKQAILYQNTPNPFSQITTIVYFLPEDTREAMIRIYDMNGTEIVAFPIDVFGQGELTIDGETLRAGMYLYSLIADGQLIDTKQMILTK